ncbi:MAG TPA: hypothetical protein VEA38_16805, partial [Terriglobales bacterium]|nr:hypothetical protein [Terriglobales bacterium]
MSDRASSGGRPDQRMDLLVLLDASGGTIVPTGYGHRVGVFSGFSPEGSPIAKDTDEGSLDYRCLRWHDLQKFTGLGIRDRRLSVQHQVDWPAPYTDVRPGDAPYAQPENFTALNRTTRWADSDGRVALPTSLTRLIGSEDQRDAVAIALRSPPLEAAEPASKNRGPATLAAGAAVPDGVAFRDASNQGSVTSSIPDRVAVNGVTYFGPAAVAAAKDAINRGGTAGDVARAALSAARGTPPPPFFEGTRERGAPPAQGPGGTRAREPEPETNPDGSVLLSDHPLAYVWSENGDRIGLAGTFFDPAGEALQYFAGREGTAIGALPMRHDAHVTMGPEMTGRIMFVPDDAAGLPDPTGKPIKGEMWRDSSRANLDTNIGLETCQWRPVIRVSAEDVGSVQPPPPWGKRDEEPKTKPDESRTPGGIIADGATQERKPDLVV